METGHVLTTQLIVDISAEQAMRVLDGVAAEVARLDAAITKSQQRLTDTAPVGVAATIAAGLVLAGSPRRRVSRRQLLTFGRRG